MDELLTNTYLGIHTNIQQLWPPSPNIHLTAISPSRGQHKWGEGYLKDHGCLSSRLQKERLKEIANLQTRENTQYCQLLLQDKLWFPISYNKGSDCQIEEESCRRNCQNAKMEKGYDCQVSWHERKRLANAKEQGKDCQTAKELWICFPSFWPRQNKIGK